MTVQAHNAPATDLQSTTFVRRNETQQCLGVSRALFLSLPGLRGFWPMAAYTDTGAAIDASSNGRTLTYNGNPTYNLDGLAPYIDFDGTGDFLSRADEAGLDILGTETFIASGLRGLTMGGWVYPTVSAVQILMSKTAGASNASYSMFMSSSTSVSARVSTDGTTLVTQIATPTVSVLDKWNFFVMRYTPSAELLIRVMNTDETISGTLSAGVPASLFNGTAPFNIGNRGSAASFLFTGRASMCFLCATALPDGVIDTLFQNSRGIFGV